MAWFGNGFSQITGQISNLTKEVLTESTEEVDDHATELRIFRSKYAELETFCQSQKTKIARLHGETSELAEKLESSELQTSAICAEYRNKLQQKEEAIRRLKLRENELEERLQSPLAEGSTVLTHSFSAPSIYKMDFTENEVEDVVSSQQEISQLRGRIRSLETECQRWRDTKDEGTGPLSGNSKDKDEKEKVSVLRALVKGLQEQLDDGLNRHQGELAALQDMHSEKMRNAKRKQQGNANGGSHDDDEVQRLRDEVNHLSSINRKLQTDLELTHAADREKGRRLATLGARLQQQQADGAKVSEREASREEERAALLGELEAMMAERHLLKTTIHQLTEDVTRAREESTMAVDALSAERRSGGEERSGGGGEEAGEDDDGVSQLDLLRLEWEIERETLEEALATTRQQLQEQHSEGASDQQPLGLERNEVAQLKAKLQQYVAPGADLSASLADQLDAEIGRRQDQLDSIASQLATVRDHEAALSLERDQLAVSLASRQSEKDALNSSLAQLDADHEVTISHMIAGRDRLRARVAELEEAEGHASPAAAVDHDEEQRLRARVAELEEAGLEAGRHASPAAAFDRDEEQRLRRELDVAATHAEQTERQLEALQGKLEAVRAGQEARLADRETGLVKREAGLVEREAGLVEQEARLVAEQVRQADDGGADGEDSGSVAAWRRQCSEARRESTVLSGERDALRERVATLEADKAGLKEQQAHTRECVGEAQRLQADVQQLMERHDADRRHLLEQLDTAEAGRMCAAELHAVEVERLRGRVGALSGQLEARGGAERSQMVGVLSEKTRECAQLRAEQQRLVAALAQRDDEMGRDAVRRLSGVIRERDDELAALRQRTASLLDVLHAGGGGGEDGGEAAAVTRLLDERDKLGRQVAALQADRVQLTALLSGKHEESVIFHAEAERLAALLMEERQAREAESRREEAESRREEAGPLREEMGVWREEAGRVEEAGQKAGPRREEAGRGEELERVRTEAAESEARATRLAGEVGALRDALDALRQGGGEEVEGLQDQVGELKMERDELRLALQQTDSEQLYTKLQQMMERERKQSRELERLRHHLVAIEENYTQDAVQAEGREKTVRDRLAFTEEQLLSSSTAVQSASVEASERMSALERQLHAIAEQRDNAMLQLASAQLSTNQYAASLANLQMVLEQFQQEKDDHQTAEVERCHKETTLSRQETVQLRDHTTNLQAQLDDMCEALEAASRLSEQLDRKEEAISALREEVQLRETELRSLEGDVHRLRGSSDEKVDKALLKNLLLGYFHAPSNKRTQVLKLVCNVLGFTDDEVKQIGVDSSTGWLGGLLRKPQGSQGKASNKGALDTSFSELFVKFLERESSPPPVVHLPIDSLPDAPARRPINPFSAPLAPVNPRPNHHHHRDAHLLDAPINLPLLTPTLNALTGTTTISTSSILRDVLQ